MRNHRTIIAVAMACVCMLILSGIAMAGSPATPQASPSAQTTPSPEGTPDTMATPGIANANQAIQHLGLHQFPDIYVGEVVQPDGSVVIQLGPGDDTAFTNALGDLLAAPATKALGPVPAVTIEHVPHNQADFDAALNAFIAALPQLDAQGFTFAHSEPDIAAGIYNIAFSAAPPGLTAAAATDELQQTVSPMIQVISVNEASVHLANNVDRGHDEQPFKGSDLIHNITSPDNVFCTAGFTVIGAAGTPRGSTDAHCNEGSQRSDQTFTNGGYVVNGYNPAPQFPSRDGSTPITFGTESNWQYNSLAGTDIELFDNSGHQFKPDVWVGQGLSAPTELPVGPAYADVPVAGVNLTIDGAFSREHRWMLVTYSNSTTCLGTDYYTKMGLGLICDLIQMNLFSDYPDQWPGPAVQKGDSGGPVFCYACYGNGHAEPAGLIEGFANDPNYKIAWATYIGYDLDAIGGGAHIDTAP